MTHYLIRVSGALSEELLSAFPNLLVERAPVQTLLHGQLPDQAALTGVLDHLDELGIQIVEVMQVPDQMPVQAAPSRSRR